MLFQVVYSRESIDTTILSRLDKQVSYPGQSLSFDITTHEVR